VTGYGRPFHEVLRALGERARQLRLQRALGQAELASRADVGIATVRRFEKTGSASIENVLRIATALHADAAFDKLFEPPAYESLDEALARPGLTTRKRAPRRR
jgi:transcriptional regulator with XRE-family HTH domain